VIILIFLPVTLMIQASEQKKGYSLEEKNGKKSLNSMNEIL